eukprot:scaffold11454_cov168-Amphora_coffeaeformis.AAC.15
MENDHFPIPHCERKAQTPPPFIETGIESDFALDSDSGTVAGNVYLTSSTTKWTDPLDPITSRLAKQDSVSRGRQKFSFVSVNGEVSSAQIHLTVAVAREGSKLEWPPSFHPPFLNRVW